MEEAARQVRTATSLLAEQQANSWHLLLAVLLLPNWNEYVMTTIRIY
jgi:hypothetical protein